MPTGTHDISQLLAARFTSAAEFGFERIREVLTADLANHNRQVQDMLSSFSKQTTERQGITGSSIRIEAQEVDEYGAAPAQKDVAGNTVAFPLRKYQIPTGYTRDWLSEATPADVAERHQAVLVAHLRRIRRDLSRALFIPTNYNFKDLFRDKVTLKIKRLANADGANIPDSPSDGQSFDGSTHTHYLANATLDSASSDELITTVIEHTNDAALVIAIAQADATTWTNLSGFIPLQAPYIQTFRSGAALPDVPIQRLDISRTNNRQIGWYGAAEVWVKPWAIPYYALCYDKNGSPPLAMRQKKAAAMQGLMLAETQTQHPLRVDFYEAYFGFGVDNRLNGAILYFNGATYVAPSIT